MDFPSIVSMVRFIIVVVSEVVTLSVCGLFFRYELISEALRSVYDIVVDRFDLISYIIERGVLFHFLRRLFIA